MIILQTAIDFSCFQLLNYFYDILLYMCLLKNIWNCCSKPLHDFFSDVPIIFLSRSLVSSSRVLFLAAPHWALGKPVEKVVILEQGKYLPSWVSEVTDGVTGAFDVVPSVEKYLILLFKPLHDNITNNNRF